MGGSGEVFLGEPYVCFKSDTYNQALLDVSTAGFDVSRDRVRLTGEYSCIDGMPDVLIDMSVTPHGISRTWTDRAGVPHPVIDVNELPDGVRAVIGQKVYASDEIEALGYRSMAAYYKCNEQGGGECKQLVDAYVRSGRVEIEESRQARIAEEEQKKKAALAAKVATLINRGDAIWERAAKLIRLADQCDGGWGGIEASDLQEVYDKYLPGKPALNFRSFENAVRYDQYAEMMIREMLKKYSAYATIDESSEDNCSHSSYGGCSDADEQAHHSATCYLDRYKEISVSWNESLNCTKPSDRNFDRNDAGEWMREQRRERDAKRHK